MHHAPASRLPANAGRFALALPAVAQARSGAVRVVRVDAAVLAHPFPHFWEQGFGFGRAILTLRGRYRTDLRAGAARPAAEREGVLATRRSDGTLVEVLR
jgi:hypothetical protein